MLRDRSELENNLVNAIERIKYKRKNIEEVNKTLSEYDIPSGFFNEIIKKQSLLGDIDTAVLCLISMAIFKIDGADDVRTENYFTEGEILEAKKHTGVKDSDANDVKLPIPINSVLQIDHENYVTTIKISEPVKWYHNKIIVYDFETQRSAKYKRGRDGVVPVPDVNLQSVKDIAEHMLNETYLPDMITLNVYSEEIDPITYNPKSKVLTIKEGATVSILDGFHRLQGAVRALSVNPDLRQDIILSIRVFDTDTAKKYFGQINTINVVKTERLEELKQEKVSYVAVKQLQINSDLKGKIASGSKISELAGQYTTSDILANAIDQVFEPKTAFEAKEVGVYLTDFFNNLLGIFSDEFNTKTNLLRQPRMFIGYIVIAKIFKDKDVPFSKIKDIIEKIIAEDKELDKVVTYNKGTSSRLQKLVKEHFEKINILGWIS
ncbi:DNA sulfur modification protein DndB [Paenibacillus chitinolyticus]|uniref:DNA sulfur modification protein DndB n=1 Tax=Paenibacillus chitinolyticus TaxID=79263 RepID=UPI00366D147C